MYCPCLVCNIVSPWQILHRRNWVCGYIAQSPASEDKFICRLILYISKTIHSTWIANLLETKVIIRHIMLINFSTHLTYVDSAIQQPVKDRRTQIRSANRVRKSVDSSIPFQSQNIYRPDKNCENALFHAQHSSYPLIPFYFFALQRFSMW